ncbi:lipid-A-disaccharide synthase [Helicobacter cappadocius]|uniref:Lipid-A-disaccharide synthase n=1 Tax=Helicobacter cappadocius TaxID=3063998 RepID=A0AA90PK33_9HELI|nr:MULTISPECIES: lipid-A-disaccharide synthase [unclassified Helicobacter]MDO7253828.1 lipid-A-disaccharide synthase [Helicobacter sp. faydin-H75]MDP2539717.1 lipid-A-disaccharide synthase [Helicobacter sp. faydin-H76]
MKKILISALEPSSNIHLRELKKYLKDIEFIGIFDEDLGSPLYSPKKFSTMAFLDVLKKIKFFYKANKKMIELSKDADLVLLLDSSSFNIPLAKGIKKINQNKPIIYYILPQVWAWKAWRAKKIEKYCDRLGAILPFETTFYEKKAQYVGHPLLDEIPHYKKKQSDGSIVFMPGSRQGEIKRIFPIFLEVAKKIKNKKKILIIPHSFKNSDLYSIYGKDVDEFDISFDTHKSLYEAEFAFICSGTATLEATLIGTPFVLGYKMKKIDFFITRIFVKLSCIGLANIFYNALNNEYPGKGKTRLHQELVQEDLNCENLINAYESINREKFLIESEKIREYLRHGSAENIANWIKLTLN